LFYNFKMNIWGLCWRHCQVRDTERGYRLGPSPEAASYICMTVFIKRKVDSE
jgi:hypothetical protein